MSDVSRETAARLDRYAALIRTWNPRINLIAPATVADLEQRHIADCLQLVAFAQPTGGLWADLGSGGGLPGLVVAIACMDRPVRFLLVESDQRKSAFLRTVIRELGLTNASVTTARIEAIDPLNAAYISARALAPLPRLMPYLDRHLAEDGQAWLMKGRQWQAELSEARKAWKFHHESFASSTQDGAAILKIGGVQDVGA